MNDIMPLIPDPFNLILFNELKSLGDQGAEDAIRDLIRAECLYLGIPILSVDASLNMRCKDGGIDAKVNCSPEQLKGGRGIIPSANTYYQVKSGHIGLTEDLCKSLVLDKIKGTKDFNLKPLIKECLEQAGHLVFCLFGNDTPDPKDSDGNIKLFCKVIAPYYTGNVSDRIHLWQANKLQAVFSLVPAVTWRLKKRQGWAIWALNQWQKNDGEMRKEWVETDSQSHAIIQLHKALEYKSSKPQHLRILGDPGVGKTRMVYQALDTPNARATVLFASGPSILLENSDLMRELQEGDTWSVTLVVDECSEENANKIWDRLETVSYPLSLITIHNESQKRRSIENVIDLKALDERDILEILQQAGMPEIEARHIAPFCEGSPRAAHIFRDSFATSPEDFTREALSYERLWSRYLAGEDKLESDETRNKQLVLKFCAAFKRFGNAGQYKNEAENIYLLLCEIGDRNFSRDRFLRIIESLKSRKIFQGDQTLYITPKGLHLCYWNIFWEDYRYLFNFEIHFSSLPLKLQDWMTQMVVYSKHSKAAGEWVEWLVGPEGPFQKKNFLNSDYAGDILLKICSVKPKHVARYLEETFANWSYEELLSFNEGRRGVVHSLERLALYESTFETSARILLALAEAENEDWSNNSTGIIKGIFHPFSQSEVNFDERFDLLEDFLEEFHNNHKKYKILLAVLIEALDTHHSFSLVDDVDLSELPLGQQTYTVNSLNNAHIRVWRRAVSLLKKLTEKEELTLLGEALCRYLRSYISTNTLEDIKSLYDDGVITKAMLIKALSMILYFDHQEISKELIASIKDLKKQLEGTSFKDRLERFVKLRVPEDQYQEKLDRNGKLHHEIDTIANEIIDNPNLLPSELPWITTHQAENAGILGAALGEKDEAHKLWQSIINLHSPANEDGSSMFLGLYLSGIRKHNVNKFYSMIQEISAKPNIATLLPEVIWRAGLDDTSAILLAEKIEEGVISYRSLSMMSMGMAIQPLSLSVITRLVKILLANMTMEAGGIAVSILTHYLHDKEERLDPPVDLIEKALLHPAFYGTAEKAERRQTMTPYYWGKLAEDLYRLDYEKSFKIFECGLAAFGKEYSLFENYYEREVYKFFSKIVESSPQRSWESLRHYIEESGDDFSRRYHITRWLCKGNKADNGALPPPPIEYIPYSLIKDWIDKDKKNRAWAFAYYLAKPIYRYTEAELLDSKSLIAKFIADYGNRPDVREHLPLSAYSESWSGPESIMINQRIEWIDRMLTLAIEPNLKRLLEECKNDCEVRGLHAIRREERDEY